MIQVPSSFPYRYQRTDTEVAGYVLRNSESIAGLFCVCTESGISSLKKMVQKSQEESNEE